MTKQTITILIIIALFILLIANKDAIAKWGSKNKNNTPGNATDATGYPSAATNVNNSISNPAGGLDYGKQLKIGSKGNEVKQLQTWLNMLGAQPVLVIDGYFGVKTANALKKINAGATSTTLQNLSEKMAKYVPAMAPVNTTGTPIDVPDGESVWYLPGTWFQ